MKTTKLNNYIFFYFLLSIILFLPSCKTAITQVGKLNMISNRNVDIKNNYQKIKSYASLTKRELKKTECRSIDEAIDKTVKSVPGGEFIMNAKIYLVKNQYFAVEGDIWGNNTQEHLGFTVGVKVQWKNNFVDKIGTITSLTNDNECMVKQDGKEKSKKMKYKNLVKVD